MSTTDNKVKLQLRPSLPGSGPGVINRPDKNPSPSKLMINHGKPNYTINRTTSNLKNKSPTTTEIVTSPTLAFPLKSTINSLSPVSSSTATVMMASSQSQSNQIEKVVLKHVQSTNINSNNQGPVINSKPPPPPLVSPVNSFVSPGISSKAAATSFGVKLKQCNNKKNIQNGDNSILNGQSQNKNDEPEFVRRQKQIFEKLQQREYQQQQQNIEMDKTINNINRKEENVIDSIISNEINSQQQNGHTTIITSNNLLQQQTNGYHSQEKINVDSHVKNVMNRLENVSSSNTIIDDSNEQQKQPQQQNNNNNFKLPPGAICGKPAIPGKPANLQIPSGRFQQQQQNNITKNLNNSINTINSNSESFLTKKIDPSEITIDNKTAEEIPVTTTTTTPAAINNENIIENSNVSANFEQKTVVSFSKDLSKEPNRYPDTIKITKTINNSNDLNNDNNIDTLEDDDDEGLREFIANEKTSKLAEEMAQIKFDIKTDEEDVTITPVVIR